MMRSWFSSLLPAVAALCFAAALLGGSHRAHAQAIVLSVNGDPVTSVDLEQRMKLLRALHKPATHDAAVESMIAERLKAHEGARFGIAIKDDEIGEQVQTDAKKAKTTPQLMMQEIQRNGVAPEHARNYFKAELAYFILIRALNKGVEASEIAVRGELAKEKGKSSLTTYTLRQVVVTINPGEGPEMVASAGKQAEALRSRFSSCASGITYAKSLPGVAVREPLTRSSSQLSDGMKELLDKTPVGHLTPPSRSSNGIELIAVCDRGAARNDDELRKVISERLLADHMQQETAAKYKEMREHAVIDRPRG